MKNIITILDAIRWTTSKFNASHIFYGHGTDNPLDEAKHLILPSLNLPINVPSIIYKARLTENEKKKIIKLTKKRINMKIPVPYLTNQAWFCKLKFYVDKRVIIPRSPIGEIIQNKFNNLLPYSPLYILDMCTGSGCIAIATAIKYPRAQIDAVDISLKALKIAEHNIALYNLSKRVIPIHSNLFNNVPSVKYDIIITNPPYVKYQDINDLPKEFKQEPKLSLLGGQDGLKFIRRILIKSPKYLKKNGILFCEVGNNKNKLIQLYPKSPFYWIPLNNGGDGVFMLNKKQLIINNKYFSKKLKLQ